MKYTRVHLVVASLLLMVSMVLGVSSETEPKPQAETAARTAAIISVRDLISDVTLESMKRRVDEAQAAGANYIVFEVDTYGGLVTSALEICDYIKSLEVENIAWVHPKAISAGAMISIACDGIVMSTRSKIGDCAPIALGATLEGTERAKIESPILEEFRDSARRNGYPITLCEVMIKQSPAVYQIRNERTEDIEYVYENELKNYGLSPADLVEGVERISDEADGEPTPDAPDAAVNAVVSTDWVVLALVNRTDELLTLSQDQAVEHGFARKIIADEAELAAYLNAESPMMRLDSTWSEQLANWLTSPEIRGILILVVMVCGYMELQSPGVGVPGAVAVAALVVLLGAPFLTGLAGVMDVLMILAGFALILVELFLLPGFGIAGITGIILLLWGLLLTFVPPEPDPTWIPTLPATWRMMEEGIITIMVAMALTVLSFYLLTKYFGAIPILNRLVLQSPQPSAAGAAMAVAASAVDSDEPGVGAIGRVVSELRPVGRADFDGELLDVVTEGGLIEPGRSVRIVEIRGNRIVVEEA